MGLARLASGHTGVTLSVAKEEGARILFGRARNLDLWSLRLERQTARVESWRRTFESPKSVAAADLTPSAPSSDLLPLALKTPSDTRPLDDTSAIRSGDSVWFAVFEDRRPTAESWLESQGWTRE